MISGCMLTTGWTSGWTLNSDSTMIFSHFGWSFDQFPSKHWISSWLIVYPSTQENLQTESRLFSFEHWATVFSSSSIALHFFSWQIGDGKFHFAKTEFFYPFWLYWPLVRFSLTVTLKTSASLLSLRPMVTLSSVASHKISVAPISSKPGLHEKEHFEPTVKVFDKNHKKKWVKKFATLYWVVVWAGYFSRRSVELRCAAWSTGRKISRPIALITVGLSRDKINLLASFRTLFDPTSSYPESQEKWQIDPSWFPFEHETNIDVKSRFLAFTRVNFCIQRLGIQPLLTPAFTSRNFDAFRCSRPTLISSTHHGWLKFIRESESFIALSSTVFTNFSSVPAVYLSVIDHW